MVATERTVLVRLKGNASDLNRAILSSAAAVGSLRKEIDTTNDRTAWLAQGLLALAPAAMPVGAAIVPAITGLATQLGLAVGAVGTLALGFNGIGDSFKALNEYQLEPTAENLAKVREEFAKIGPDGAEFVMFLDEIGPKFTELQMAAREGMFPGMTEGLEDIVGMLPQVERIVSGMAEGIGQLSADAGEGLSGPGFEEFFDYLERDAKPLLIEMGRTVGNFAEGLANMMVGFAPVTAQFSSGFLEMSRSFAEWSHGLDSNDSFQSFLRYVQEVGPMVLDLFGSLVDVTVEYAKAAAPVGEVMVPALAALADITATLVATPLGPVFVAAAAGMSLYGRAAALAQITTGGLAGKLGSVALSSTKGVSGVRTLSSDIGILGRNALTAGAQTERMATQSAAAAGRLRTTGTAIGKTGAAVAGLTLATTGAADGIGLTNTASLALMGTLAGPWGAAVGGAVGFTMDLAAANDDLEAAITNVDDAIASADLSKMQSAQSGLNQKYAEQLGLVAGLRGTFPALAKGYDAVFGKTDEAQGAQRRLNVAMEVARGELRSLGHVMPAVALQSRRFALAAERQALALKESRNSARETARQFITLGDGLDDAKVSLNGWLRQLEKQAEALRDFRLNAERAANRGLRQGLIAALEEAGPAGALRMEQLANATDTQIRRANQAWTSGQREVRRYTDEIGGVPREVNTDVNVDTSGAQGAISNVEQWLNSIQDEIVYVNVERRGGGVQKYADGGEVMGLRYPYGDKVLSWLAPGEEVITNRNGEADQFRTDRDAGRIPAYANGGTVAMASASRQSISVAAPSVSVSGRTQVFLDSREIRAVVRSEMASAATFDRRNNDR